MADYQIICVDTKEPHRHIVSVGTAGSPSVGPARAWTVTEVRSALARGDRFHTIGPASKRRAEVHPDTCRFPGCTVATIRSEADAVPDNNLDNLQPCSSAPR